MAESLFLILCSPRVARLCVCLCVQARIHTPPPHTSVGRVLGTGLNPLRVSNRFPRLITVVPEYSNTRFWCITLRRFSKLHESQITAQKTVGSLPVLSRNPAGQIPHHNQPNPALGGYYKGSRPLLGIIPVLRVHTHGPHSNTQF